MDPALLEQGPIGLSAFNYSNWNPIAFTDPDGRVPLLATGAIGAVIGVGFYAAYAYARDEEMSWARAGAAAGTGFVMGASLGAAATVAPGAVAAVFTGVAIEKSAEAGIKVAMLAEANQPPGGKQLLEVALDLASAGLAAQGAGMMNAPPDVKYHYTSAPESSFKSGFWKGSSVTDDPALTSADAADKLGIPPPDKVIPIVVRGGYFGNKSKVSPTPKYSGGGNQWFSKQTIPAKDVLPAKLVCEPGGGE